jgi:hypothetical protein
MRHYIEKLTYTSALRLYRLPRPSQLLSRLGPDWYVAGQGNLPMVVARSCALPGKRNQRPTALEALALKVPSSGPKVDLTVLASSYSDGVAPPLTIYLFNTSTSAIQAVKNPRSIKAHSFALRFHKALTTLFLSHRDVHIIMCWAPRDDELEGSRLASYLATRACRVDLADLPNGMDRVQSAAYQKDRTRRRTFLNWEKEYWLARAHNDLQVDATGFPLDGVAYQYVISQPPSKKNHPLWAAATAMEKDEQGRKTRCPLFSRRTTSTTLQLAVDHTFTGSYAKRFRPTDPPSSLRCPCGFPLRTPHHLIRDCRLFYLKRVGHKIIDNDRTLSLKTLFSTTTQMAHRLLSFIANLRAAMRPPEIGRWANIPPEPD